MFEKSKMSALTAAARAAACAILLSIATGTEYRPVASASPAR
jgi:hypothetical protein